MPGFSFKRLLISSVVVLATLAVAAPSVSAATRPTTFRLYMGQSTVSGYSSDGASVHVVWRGVGGALKRDAVYTAAKHGGYWEAASSSGQVVRVGNIVKATVNGKTHKLVVPLLRIRISSASDLFYGRAPAGSTIKLGWDNRGSEVSVKVGSDGHWRYSEPGFDVPSGLHAYARWMSKGGDTVTFDQIAS